MKYKLPLKKYTLSQKIIFTAIACIIVSSIIFNKYYKPENTTSFTPDSTLLSTVAEFEQSLIPTDTTYFRKFPTYGNNDNEIQLPPKRVFTFNPNNIDSFELLELGFKPFMAHNLLQYRRRGGKINNEKNFKKIYNIDTALITSLSDFIIYPAPENSVDSSYSTNHKHYFAFDLNRADTTLLCKLPGIGISRAKMIINYKKRLGGYTNANQLLEIEGIPDSITTPLLQYATADIDSVKRIKINKSGVKFLRNHPYINYYQAKEIYELRWNRTHNGIIKPKDMKLLKEFTPEEIERLLPYLDFSE